VLVPFSPRLLAQEIVLAQRYYEKSYQLADPPGTTTYNGATYQPYVSNLPNVIYTGGGTVFFKVRKRITPVFHAYSPQTGTVDKVRDQLAGPDVTPTDYCAGENSVMVYATMSAAATGIAFSYHWTADAEFYY
jgi:hypothetical protein